ncbi:MAG TPA: ABC-F family ATP-binding cassette domain-containing protein [Solirubrobacteraceae bacterium]|nr:ABC-F family ATP-binding cassette domain-containing protein [Solirubrobacteraceae bacterium]
MAAVCIAADLAKDMAGSPLLRGVSFKLERRERMTVAGANGTGKTTLLRMLAGEASVDGGELTFAKGTRLALHDQRPPRERGLSLREYVFSGAAHLIALAARLSDLEAAMASGDASAATLDRYASAQAALEHAGGYRWRDEVLAVTHGLGFADADLDRPLRTFSGGELTRGSLARALAGDPDLLLLDEPTNHLDVDALEWLEQRLAGMDAAIVLVAHDRWFLEAVGTSVLELENGRGRFFAGPWHAWRRERAARELAAGRAAARQEAEIARLERFVERFRAGTRARQAQSRAKKLSRLDPVATAPGAPPSLSFDFVSPERSGRVVFELEGATVAVGSGSDGIEGEPGGEGRVLLRDASLWLERGEHVSLVGPNGSGKTTLLDVLAGGRSPAAGRVRRGHNVTVGFLSQHADELGEAGSVLEAAQRATGLTPNKARALLGRFLFSGEEVEKPLAGLSGGERRRLSLAILVHSGANVLVLDEPTNHLDLDSREALEDALRAFAGSVLLVSHDRALLDAVGTRTVAVEDGTLRSYAGGWAEYLRVRAERREAEAAAPKRAARPSARATPARASAGPSKNQLRRRADLERRIEEAESALSALEDELGDPSAWADPDRAADSTARHESARRAVDSLYAEWERTG